MTFADWFFGHHEALGQGPGTFSVYHYCFIGFCCVVAILAFIYGKYRNRERTELFVKASCIYLLIDRTIRIMLLFAAGEIDWTGLIPFHLCHISAYLIPICYLCRSKIAFPGVAFCGMAGGFLTVSFGDYFERAVPSFMDIESIIMHLLIYSIPIILLANGSLRLKKRDALGFWCTIHILASWGLLGNYWLGRENNFMYLMNNGMILKDGTNIALFPGHFISTYGFIIACITLLVYFIGLKNDWQDEHIKVKVNTTV